MSGCFAWGLDAGKGIRELSLAAGTDPLAQGLPVLCVVLLGGFTTNFIWCSYLIYRNRSVGQFVGRPESGSTPMRRPRLLRNYLLAAFGGTLVVPAVLLLHDGREPDGPLRVLELDAAHGIDHLVLDAVGICAQGVVGREFEDPLLVWSGIGLLVGSTLVIGWGNSLACE